MTYGEIVHEYRKLFVMLVEKAGRETGNTSYQRVEEILKEKKVEILEEGLIQSEPEFVIIVCSYLVLLFCDIYGIDGVEEWDQVRLVKRKRHLVNLSQLDHICNDLCLFGPYSKTAGIKCWECETGKIWRQIQR